MSPKNIPFYNFAKMLEYCERRGIEPKMLSKEERNLFIIERNKN